MGIYEGLRTHILIHVANSPSEVQDCLAVGEAFGYVHDQWLVVRSGSAFESLMAELNNEPATLFITKA